MDYLMTPNPLFGAARWHSVRAIRLAFVQPAVTQKTLLVNPHPLLDKTNLIFKSEERARWRWRTRGSRLYRSDTDE